MDTSWNGLWVDSSGDPFIVAAPQTIWAEFGGRHYSAYQMRTVDNGGFYGLFESSREFAFASTGRFSGDQLQAQRLLLVDKKISGEPTPPSQFPVVTPPRAPADSGEIKIDAGATSRVLKIQMTSSDQRDVFGEQIYFVGDSTKLSMDGGYESGELAINVHETGERSRRNIDGTMTLLGTTMSLHGHRTWSRGGFDLTDRNTANEVGHGWIVWEPSRKFLLSMLNDGTEGPTDQVEIWVYLDNGRFPSGYGNKLVRQK